MTKDNAKDFLPLVQALAEGKTIQHYWECNHTWEDCDDLHFDDDVNTYRIKPKFFVFKKNDGTYYKSTEFEHNTKGANWQFEGYEENCDKWIEEHTPKYVPFESVDELIECWADKRKIPLLGVDGKAVWNPIDMPLIWVKGETGNQRSLITDFDFERNSVELSYVKFGLEELFNEYTFLDGTPIGKIKG